MEPQALYLRFPDAGMHRLAAPLDVLGKTDVHG